MQNRGSGSSSVMREKLNAFLAKARQRPELHRVNSTYRANSKQLFVDLDRNKAELLGVPVSEVFQTMQGYFGSQVTGQFSQYSRVWWVILQADADYRARPEDFDKVYVRSATGAMVPYRRCHDTLRRGTEDGDALQRLPGSEDHRQSGRRLQLRQAIKAMEEVAAEVLSSDFSYAWAGQALQEKGSGSTSSLAFIFGIIVVFLLLAAQFEKWTLPVAVVLTVPFAIMGALLLTWVRGLGND